MTKLTILLSIIIFGLSSFQGVSQSYPSSKASKNKDYLIKDVIFAGISNTGTGKSNYTDYTSQHATVEHSLSYTLTVKIKKKDNKYLKAWIDWNNDGDFTDSGEEFTLATNVNYCMHTYLQLI